MADYKAIRLKKNAELENAMSNIKKDLYDWKPPSNTVKINSFSKLSHSKFKSLDPNVREATLIRSGSLRDINRPSIDGTSNNSNSRKNSNNFNMKLRPISGDSRSKKLLPDDFSILDLKDLEDTESWNGTEFLTSFKSNTKSTQSERQYLYTTRPTSSLSHKKNSEEIENQLVNFIFLLQILKRFFKSYTNT
jgi:hypothetical protein